VRFEISHSFAHPLDRVAAAVLDPDYQRSLTDVESLAARELLSQDERPDGTVLRKTRCVLDLDISGVARNFIGSGDPAWIEEATWQPKESRWRWVIVPEVAKDLLEASGHIDFVAAGEETERVVAGDVKVKVPIYGGKVEGWIVEGIEAAYAEEAERLAEWLGREKP
jgi:hypothetical protein